MPEGTIRITLGSLTGAHFASNADIPYAAIAQRTEMIFPIPQEAWRIHDALQTNLTTAGSDDLGIDSGTFGSAVPFITAGDVKTTTGNRKMRAKIRIPANYEAGRPFKIRINAGMTTTAADGSCTVDVEAYLLDGNAYSGSDLVTTSATTMNSTTEANVDFTLTPTTLTPGAELDVRVSIAYVDTATGTAVKPSIFGTAQVLTTRG